MDGTTTVSTSIDAVLALPQPGKAYDLADHFPIASCFCAQEHCISYSSIFSKSILIIIKYIS